MTGRPAAGGGRWVEVAPERLAGWLERFDERHRVLRTYLDAEAVHVVAADDARAECRVPFPPLAGDTKIHQTRPGLDADALLAHACRDRTVGVLLVRLGGHAAGVFEGSALIASKVGTRPVHGRNKAGGQSQKRFQRRREEQARDATRAAADVAARVLLPYLDQLDGVVLGGDRRTVDALRPDRRLSGLFTLATERFLTVPDPRKAVLERTPERFRAVAIRVAEPSDRAS